VRYELPDGLDLAEERAIRAALDEYFGVAETQADPWSLAGRAAALGLGALQVRHVRREAWSGKELAPFTWLGTEPRGGRGDSR
jgi:hypothetical protein